MTNKSNKKTMASEDDKDDDNNAMWRFGLLSWSLACAFR
jgi:hypothetical protein